MADMESLTITSNECKTTLTKASATIRDLIKQRDAALTAADPASLALATKETEASSKALSIRSDLETARQDTEAAISEAGVIPALPPRTAAAKYPKTLADSSTTKRPSVVVTDAATETAARAAGFTIQVPPPAAPIVPAPATT
jgi:hypothetical protein